MKVSSYLVLACGAASTGAFEFPSLSDVKGALSSLTTRSPKGGNSGSSGKGEGGGGKKAAETVDPAGIPEAPEAIDPAGAVDKRDGGGACPAIWTTVSKDLTSMFLTNGQCNDDARAAIRAVFHDCGTWNKAQGSTGGCDGSLILAQEYNRAENNGLQDISTKLLALAKQRNVGVADMLVFAGNHATVTCPGGPQVKTFVGRKDSSKPAPDGLLPDVRASGDSLYALFQDKGFDARDLAALVGAHSTSKQFFVDPAQAGKPQDSTPGLWDVKFYGETLQNPPPAENFRFQSDVNLANHAVVGKEFKGFVDNQGKWTGKFADAMMRMTLLGVPGGSANLADCTNALPKSTNSKREVRMSNPFMHKS